MVRSGCCTIGNAFKVTETNQTWKLHFFAVPCNAIHSLNHKSVRVKMFTWSFSFTGNSTSDLWNGLLNDVHSLPMNSRKKLKDYVSTKKFGLAQDLILEEARACIHKRA